MEEVVAHDCRRAVQEAGDLVLALAVADNFRQKLDIVAPASLDELLLD